MIALGVSSEEILNCWLSELRFSEYYSLFVSAGYDIQTITRMTPEDLTAIGRRRRGNRGSRSRSRSRSRRSRMSRRGVVLKDKSRV